MRVLHLSTAHPTEDTRIFVKEARTLAAHGHDVHLVITAPADFERDGVKVHALPPRAGRLYRFTVKPYLAYKKIAAINPDLIHFHDPDLILLGFLFRRRGKHVIYDAHEDLPRQVEYKEWIPEALRGPVAWLTEKLEDALVPKLSAIVTATPHIAKRFARLNPRSVSVSNYPLLAELAAPAGTDWSAREKIVVYAGALTPERGGYELLEAARQSGVKVHIAGHVSPQPMLARVQECVKRGEVVYYGQVARNQVLDLMRRARAGIVCFHALPNHTEAQPNKLFEYMSAGLPLIASNFPLWREMLDATQCGIACDPRKVQEIAAAMRTLMDDDAKAQAMGARGQRAVLETYNWESEAKKLFALYDELQKNPLRLAQ